MNLEAAEAWLRKYPIQTFHDLSAFEAECERLRRERPLVADDSVDLVGSSCVLNLVKPQDKAKLFQEIYRVLKRGGRAVISDIVSDEDATPSIMSDPKLWSDCIARAFREDTFLEMFERAGFYGIEILSRQSEPWRAIEGIEFRSVTVQAFKGKEGPCWEWNQAVICRGPWKSVKDDDRHTYTRGTRIAVCDKTHTILTDPDGPYSKDILSVPPRQDIPLEDAKPFECQGTHLRHPCETKGYRIQRNGGQHLRLRFWLLLSDVDTNFYKYENYGKEDLY